MLYATSLAILQLVALTSLLEQPADDLVERVSAGNAATLQSIQTYYCNVVYLNSSKDDSGTPVAEYWRTKDFTRLRERRPSSTIDVRSEGGRSQQVTTLNGQRSDPKDIYVTFEESSRFGLESNAWQLSLFDLPATVTQKPPLFIYNLADLVNKGTILDSGWGDIDGNKVAHLSIELHDERRSYELWVDPKKNWLVVHLIHKLMDLEGKEIWRIEHKIEEFREIKPSLLIPTLTSFSVKYRSKPVKEVFVRFDGIRVNEPLPPVPAMPIPAGGSLAIDLVEGTSFRIDGNGRRYGNSFKIGTEINGFAKQATTPGPNLYRTWGWIFGGVALSIFVIALVLLRRSMGSRSW